MKDHYNPHWNKNIKFSFCSFRYNSKVDTTIKNVFEKCKNFLIPYMQNSIVKYGFHQHLQTMGRYDVDSSMNYDMNEQEKIFAKNLYKSKECEEWPFYINETQVSVIISKGGLKVNLVFESPAENVAKILSENGFTKMPCWDDWYLTKGFIKPSDAINILIDLNRLISQLY